MSFGLKARKWTPRRTRHLSKHVSEPSKTVGVKLHPSREEGDVFHEEVISHRVGWRWNKNAQILQKKKKRSKYS